MFQPLRVCKWDIWLSITIATTVKECDSEIAFNMLSWKKKKETLNNIRDYQFNIMTTYQNQHLPLVIP